MRLGRELRFERLRQFVLRRQTNQRSLELLRIGQLGQRRQVFQRLEIQIIQELTRGGEQCRAPRPFTMAHLTNPLALEQGFQNPA